jgi:glycosyltransferase involved in cell wall biosynthesis
MKVDLVYPDRGRAIDGIGDYADCLARVMRQVSGVETTFVRVRTGRQACLAMLRRRSSDAILIQYMPFSWGRWGFAPSLVLTVAAMRATRRHTVVGIMVHECYEDMLSARTALMGAWQRLQLRMLLRMAGGRAASITRFASQLEASWPRLPVARIPASSPFPDARDERDAERERRGWRGDAVVLGTMSSEHRGHLTDHVGRAANAVAAALGGCTLLMLGSGASVPEHLDPRVTVLCPGFLTADDVAPLIAACDIYLAPYLDGVSSRRTTMLAGLQQGVAIVGTKGPSTDPELLSHPALRLTAVDDAEAFAEVAAAIASDAAARAEMASRASALFVERYSFSVVVRQWLDQLGAAEPEMLGTPSASRSNSHPAPRA